MKISQRVIKKAIRSYTAGEWRLVPIKISRASCTALSDPYPPGGPWKPAEVRCNPDGTFWVYLIKGGTYLPGDRIQFDRDEIDYWLSLQPLPWRLEIE